MKKKPSNLFITELKSGKIQIWDVNSRTNWNVKVICISTSKCVCFEECKIKTQSESERTQEKWSDK